MVVEADHQAERHLGRAERVDEAAAERVGRERPAQRVDDAVERPLHLPDLLHAEREDLRVGRADLLPLAPRLAQRPRVPSASDRHLRGEVGRLRVARARLARRGRARTASCGRPARPCPRPAARRPESPAKRFTPSSSARSPSQRTISQMRRGVVAVLCIVGGVGIRWARPSVRK